MQGKTAIANILEPEGVDTLLHPQQRPHRRGGSAGIRPIVSRMERGAVNTADRYTRVNNGHHNGVCLAQAGPGSVRVILREWWTNGGERAWP